MSFPRYPKYKESGVESLGAVPQHWAMSSLTRQTLAKCDGPFGSGLKSEHYVDRGVRVIRLQNIKTVGFDASNEAFIEEEYFLRELAGHDVQQGDLLIAGLGDENNTVGRACVAPEGIEPAMVKADCFRFRLDTKKLLPEFAAFYLTARSGVDAGLLSTGSTRSRIPLSVMGARKIVVPPLPEQNAIVAFLDREAEKVGALVTEQRRLIELLKEKRQAVISHAVTKGLNPHAPMKDSRVEWLGKVPEHWVTIKIKHLALSIEQGWSPQCENFPAEGEEWGVLKVGCVNGGRFDPSENKALPKELSPMPSLAALRGDLLISRANTRELVGSAAVVETDCPTLMLCDKLYRIRVTEAVDPRFVSYYLGSIVARRRLEIEATGASASMLNIGQSTVMELVIAIPSRREQAGILEVIDRELNRLNDLSAEIQHATDVLQERRTALISAAVTGQIDVRQLAEKQAAA